MAQSNKSERIYRQRRPEQTLLYKVVQQHLLTFLDSTSQAYGRPLPQYVEKELREYLKCGIHAYGFARAKCHDCGEELLVAFSCKKRGVCPSCNARRMSDTAARLVDRVLPNVRLRQWVLSVPFEMRLLLAKSPEALSAFGRMFVEEIFRWQRGKALLRGYTEHHKSGSIRGAAISFPQRFGGSLNLNVHYHVLVPDVFFYKDASGNIQHEQLNKPSRLDLEEITHNVTLRSMRWLARKGFLADEEAPIATEQLAPINMCLTGSVGLGALVSLKASGKMSPAVAKNGSTASKRVRGGAFNVHVGAPATTKKDRERLARYCARPPLSLERLGSAPDGQLIYKLRHPIGGKTHRLLSPTDFLARLCALIPPPRHPLIRFHGVVVPCSGWRKAVVPAPPEATTSQLRPATDHIPEDDDTPEDDDATIEKKWQSQRLDWATLLKRVYDIDALACPCGGRLTFVELINTQQEARPILEQLGYPSEPPRLHNTPPLDERDIYQEPADDWDVPPQDSLPDLEAADPLPDDW